MQCNETKPDIRDGAMDKVSRSNGNICGIPYFPDEEEELDEADMPTALCCPAGAAPAVL